ncbi:MAG: hypothetical protein JNM24_12055 [Bdellovibrionaceae bacterium]|nr:hypothetical protein [Pseudobdellovibrionaceae bacterium]
MKKNSIVFSILLFAIFFTVERSYSFQSSQSWPSMKLHVGLTLQTCFGFTCDEQTTKVERDIEIYLAEQSDGKTLYGAYSYPDSWNPGFENQLAIPYKFVDKKGNTLIRLYYVNITVKGTTNPSDDFTVKVSLYRQTNPSGTIPPYLSNAESVGSALTFKMKLGSSIPSLSLYPIVAREQLEEDGGAVQLYGLHIMQTTK